MVRGRPRRQAAAIPEARAPPAGAPPAAIALVPRDIRNISIAEKYENPMAFQIMLNTIGVPDRERARITNDGFTQMNELVSHYANDVEGFKTYLENLNKTFATADEEYKVYFTPPVTSKLVGIMHYFNVAVNGFHKIPDTSSITSREANRFGQCYQEFTKKKDLEDDDDDLDIPKLLGSTNWIDFRDAFMSKLSQHAGSRGFPIDYVLDGSPRDATHGNARQEEVEYIDLDDNDEYLHLVTHFGQPYKADNAQVWNKLRNCMINTPPYNHIASFHQRKDGRGAWMALKEFYEGEDFQQRNRDRAFSKLNTTFYKGETNRFSFEKYVNIHKEAHKLLMDANYNEGRGMDDATKIQYLKANIRSEAGLETALSQIRAGGDMYNNFTRLVSFLTAEVEHHSLRLNQLKLANNRNVSKAERERQKNLRNNPPPRGNANRNPPSEVVEGKRVYGRNYPVNEFRSLSTAQRETVIRLRRNFRHNNNNGDRNPPPPNSRRSAISSLRTEMQDSMSQMEERIVAGMNQAQQTNQRPDTVTVDETESQDDSTRRRSAPSGSVGGFIANQRRRTERN
jgi:hypothetical protein